MRYRRNRPLSATIFILHVKYWISWFDFSISCVRFYFVSAVADKEFFYSGPLWVPSCYVVQNEKYNTNDVQIGQQLCLECKLTTNDEIATSCVRGPCQSCYSHQWRPSLLVGVAITTLLKIEKEWVGNLNMYVL